LESPVAESYIFACLRAISFFRLSVPVPVDSELAPPGLPPELPPRLPPDPPRPPGALPASSWGRQSEQTRSFAPATVARWRSVVSRPQSSQASPSSPPPPPPVEYFAIPRVVDPDR
jgi:hypothetical protein